MPTYVYSCSEDGQVEIVKPMADAGRAEVCPACGAALRRIYTRPLQQIIRPSGWRLSPDDPKFSDFRREMELGELVDDPTPVRLSATELAAADAMAVALPPDPARDRALHRLVRDHWTEDLSDDTVRRRELAAAHVAATMREAA